MRADKQSHMLAISCSTALLFMIAATAGAEEQPDGPYAQPSQAVVRKLLNIARKACRGSFNDGSSSPLGKMLNLGGPYYLYRERPAAEVAVILARDCPEPSPKAEFMVGRFEKERSVYYKTNAVTARPIAAAQSFFDPARNDIVFEPIAVTRELEDNYNALIGFLMTKW
jgi:hypothetical protein